MNIFQKDGYVSVSLDKNKDGLYVNIEQVGDVVYVSVRNSEGEILETHSPQRSADILSDVTSTKEDYITHLKGNE